MLRIKSVTFDAADPSALAAFWASALEWRRTRDDGDEVRVGAPSDPGAVTQLVFLRVVGAKGSKNRVHLDLHPSDQATEVARLASLGASRVHVGEPAGATWVVMADPEGNEFCVLRADGES